MRKTIAFLADSLVDGFQQTAWAGVSRAAEALDLNLLCFTSGYVTRRQPGRRMFELVDPGRLAGVACLSGTLGSSDAELRALYARFRAIPLVGIGPAMDGVPSLLTDNARSTAALVDHLVVDHGRRELAFVCGPGENAEAALRLEAFRSSLARHGLGVNPARVLPGNFEPRAGVLAVERLLAGGVRFDALLAANDDMALAAMEELARRGVRVPEQVSVAGFDDVPGAGAARPGLTTVRQPLFELTREAVALLLRAGRGEEVPPLTLVPGELVLRRSCGCGIPPRPGLPGEVGAGSATPAGGDVARVLEEAFPGLAPRLGGDDWARQLAAALGEGLETGDPRALCDALVELQARGLPANIDLGRWFSVLDTALDAVRAAGAARSGLDERLGALRDAGLRALGSAAEGLQAALRVDLAQDVNVLRRLWEINPVDPDEVWTALEERLPVIGVPSFYLCRFVEPDCTHARLEFHYTLTGAVALHPDGRAELPYPAGALVPGSFSSDRRYAFVILPVKARGTECGFVLCEVGRMGAAGYESVVHQLSAATELRALLGEVRSYATTLEAKVEERTRELGEAQRLVVDTAHRAGMAEIAVGLMHNMGNLLNSVNVSAERIVDLAESSRLSGIARAGALLPEDPAALVTFLTQDPRGKLFAPYVRKVAEELERERLSILAEGRGLVDKTGLIRDTITTLQEYARGERDLSLREPLDLRAVVETALKIQESNLSRHAVRVLRDLAPTPDVVVQRSKLVHVVVNLVKNGIEAMHATAPESRILTVQLRADRAGVDLRVTDAGEGISAANLQRVFGYGFTTKPGGHGFGLHTCANHVAQMGGTIHADSAGPGRGATFSLRFLPAPSPSPEGA